MYPAKLWQLIICILQKSGNFKIILIRESKKFRLFFDVILGYKSLKSSDFKAVEILIRESRNEKS